MTRDFIIRSGLEYFPLHRPSLPLWKMPDEAGQRSARVPRNECKILIH